VLNNTKLFPWLTLQQNIEEVLRAKDATLPPSQLRDTAHNFLERAALAGRAHTYPSKLSRAESAWGTLVRSLAIKPDVLLLEDPFTALTPRECCEVLDRFCTYLRQEPV